VVALSVATNVSTIFNFDGDSLRTSTAFTDTVNGLSAAFSSAADPGGSVVYASMFGTSRAVCSVTRSAGLDNLSISINFSQNILATTLNFATSDFISRLLTIPHMRTPRL
jgi:hypothetical protein